MKRYLLQYQVNGHETETRSKESIYKMRPIIPHLQDSYNIPLEETYEAVGAVSLH